MGDELNFDTSGLFGPSVLTGGNFGTPNMDLFTLPTPDTGGDINFLTNAPAGSVFNPGTPMSDFLTESGMAAGSPLDFSGGGFGLPNFSNLFSGGLGALSGLLPSNNSGSLLPGAMALGYALSQPGLDVGPLQGVFSSLSGNTSPLVKAATDPLQLNIAGGYGDLLQSQALRGIRGSSFGNTDIANYLSTTGNALANAGTNAAQGSLALQGNLAATIASLKNQAQLQKNQLFGSAFDVLGRGLNPRGYTGNTTINVGGGTPVSGGGSETLGDLAKVAGIGGGIAAMFSDRRLKSNVVPVGVDSRGFGIYEYDLFGKRHRGVMADEVEEVMPDAVVTVAGMKMVDYGRLAHA